MKFIYTPNPDAEEPIMLVNKQIGKDDKTVGIMGDIFQSELLELERLGKKRVEVLINTVGGTVTDGWNIYGTIQTVNSRGNTQVDTLDIGIAASTGGWIFQAGKVRRMMDYSIIMMHNPHGGDDKSTESITNSIATMLAAKSNKTEDEVLELMNRTTFMTAQEAHDMGFCDEVIDSEPTNKEKMLTVSTLTDKWEAANNIYNKHTETEIMELTSITNALGLNADAKPENITNSIKELQNKVSELQNSVDSSNAVKKEMEDKLAKAKDAYDKMKDEYDKMCNEKTEAENKAKEVEAETMVKGVAETGRIVNDEATIAEWKNTALKLGIPETKAMLEKLPLNKQAPKTDDVAKVATVPTNVTEWKNQLRNKKK